MMKKTSLKDIAQKVGVSTALVSYVLNNQKEGRISKAVAQKIRDTARELNYRTNQIAKSLKTNKTFTIGLIVADISNPFFSALARIIEDEADQKNYTVIFGSSDESLPKFRKLLDTFINRQVDGLIICPPEHSEKEILYLQEQGVPFVLTDRYFPDLNTNYVLLDNYEAAYTGIKHIVESGKRRIGMITYNTALFHIADRVRGYKECLDEQKIAFKSNWLKKVDFNIARAGIESAVKELLSLAQPVDAILFASNTIAVAAVTYINTLNIDVPSELALVTFDETTSLDMFYAPLTYIKQPLEEIGRQSLSILLKNSPAKEIAQVKLPGTLVARAST